MAIWDKANVSLEKKDKCFTWKRDGKFFYLFPTSDVKYAETQVAYWMLVFDNEDDWLKKIWGDRDVKAQGVVGIKEKVKDNWDSWLWWMMFDNDNKRTWFVNLYESTFNKPGEEVNKYLVIKETEYRERGTGARDNLPF